MERGGGGGYGRGGNRGRGESGGGRGRGRGGGRGGRGGQNYHDQQPRPQQQQQNRWNGGGNGNSTGGGGGYASAARGGASGGGGYASAARGAASGGGGYASDARGAGSAGGYASAVSGGGSAGGYASAASGASGGGGYASAARGGASAGGGYASAARGGASGGGYASAVSGGGSACGYASAVSGASGGGYAAKLQPSPQSTAAPPSRPVTPKIAEGTLQSSKGEGAVSNQRRRPMRRPDTGGKENARMINILVNHFPVEFKGDTVIGHYNIDVVLEEASAKGRPVRLSKATLSLLKDRLFAENPDFPLEMAAYDGEKNVFSAVPLPEGKYRVQLSEEEGTRQRSFMISVTLVNQLKVNKLKKYLTGEVLDLPRDVLQGMDVVMRENPRRHMVSIGRTFHPVDLHPGYDLGRGIGASWGFQHSLRPTSQGFVVCLDYSVLAVRKKLPVLDFLKEHIQGFDLGSFQRMRPQIESALKGLKVTVTHRRTKQKYTVVGLTPQRACDISFISEDPNGQNAPITVRLLDYFREKYPEVNIKHGNIPCLNVGKGGRANYVPIEFCVLAEGQRYPKENLDTRAATFLKQMSLAIPEERRKTICAMLNEQNGPCGGGIIEKFGIDVTKDMTELQTRVIKPPQVRLRSLSDGRMTNVNMDRENCQWNLMRNSVVEGMSVLRWAVLDFSHGEHPSDRLDPRFIQHLVERCNKLGLTMNQPMNTTNASMRDLASAESVSRLMKKLYDDCEGNLQLILCVMSRKDHGYNYIKWVSEVQIGVVTQCCLTKMANKGQDQYVANLGMQINGKLGGSNVDLLTPLPLFENDNRVMLIGADVNHPSPSDISSPSIAALVGSINGRVPTKYTYQVSYQKHRSEMIIGFGSLCLLLIQSYEKINKCKPEKIVIFRDGVSEGQFDMVLNEELLDFKTAMRGIGYNPTVTLLIARKRHQTRLFPATRNDGGRSGNVPPGTVVDTAIVHPLEFDFYLCSHYGIIGTSKPPHYTVLWDQHNFTSDRLQRLVYDLCFTYSNCCKPISLVPPVYYADQLAFRGRLYYEASTSGQSSSGRSFLSKPSSSSSLSETSFDASLCKLNSGIKSGLFFI